MQINPRTGTGAISAIINSKRTKKHFILIKKAACFMGASQCVNECNKIASIISFRGKVYYESGWTGSYGFCRK